MATRDGGGAVPLLQRLEFIDRRWLFLALGLAIVLPLVIDMPLPLYVSAPVRDLYDAVDALPDDLALHQNLLAYVSDYELLGTSTLPHGLPFGQGKVIMASLDHALWFHRRVQIDEWLLYSMDSPNAGGARGFARGQIFTQIGELVASTAQEGLMRVVEDAHTDRSDPRLQA